MCIRWPPAPRHLRLVPRSQRKMQPSRLRRRAARPSRQRQKHQHGAAKGQRPQLWQRQMSRDKRQSARLYQLQTIRRKVRSPRRSQHRVNPRRRKRLWQHRARQKTKRRPPLWQHAWRTCSQSCAPPKLAQKLDVYRHSISSVPCEQRRICVLASCSGAWRVRLSTTKAQSWYMRWRVACEATGWWTPRMAPCEH